MCGCNGKLQTTYVVRQFRGGVVRWWNTLEKTISPNKPLYLTWEEFLVHFKCKFDLAQNLLELENQLLTLNKDNIFIAFIDNMELTLCLVPYQLTKFDKYEKIIPWEYLMPVRQALTLEAAIWVAKFVEDMIIKGTTDGVEIGEKKKNEGFSKSNKNVNF